MRGNSFLNICLGAVVAGLGMPGTAGGQVTQVEGAEVVHSARRYVGVPYRMGGVTPRAFDCSGFIRYVFAENGIALPRTAHEQAALGEAPAVGDSLHPGDLLFFYGGRGAQHVAMYVGGDTIIHASSVAHRIRYDRFAGSGSRRTWFHQRLIAVRRILPVETRQYASVRYVPGPYVAERYVSNAPSSSLSVRADEAYPAW